MTTPNIHDELMVRPSTAPPVAAHRPLRRSFFSGKLIDPDVHPPLHTRIARAISGAPRGS